MAQREGTWDLAIHLLVGNLALAIAIVIKSTTVAQTGIPTCLPFLSHSRDQAGKSSQGLSSGEWE